jgi:acyl-coenzyme A synthetase/AMP-(fatty) acid ligase
VEYKAGILETRRHCVQHFVGFSPKAVADRVELVEPKIIFTQDYSVQGSLDSPRRVAGISPIAVFVGLELVKMLPRACSGKIMRRVLKRVWTGEALGASPL